MKTYKNDVTEVYACDSYERVGLGIHDTQTPDSRARFTLDLVKFLAVPMMMDGHPGATRATAGDVAKMAADLSKAVFDEMGGRGWMIEVPSMENLKDEARENRGKN